MPAHDRRDRGRNTRRKTVNFFDRAHHGIFDHAGNVLDLIHGTLHGVIHLLQTRTGTVSRIVQHVADALHLLAPGACDRHRLLGNLAEARSHILNHLVCGYRDLVRVLHENPRAIHNGASLVEDRDQAIHRRPHLQSGGRDVIHGGSDTINHRTDLRNHGLQLVQQGFGMSNEAVGLLLHRPGDPVQSHHDAGLHHKCQASYKHRRRHYNPKSLFRHTRTPVRNLAYRVAVRLLAGFHGVVEGFFLTRYRIAPLIHPTRGSIF